MNVIEQEVAQNRRLFLMLVAVVVALCVLSEIMSYLLASPSISLIIYRSTPILLITGVLYLRMVGYWHLYAFIKTLIRATFLFSMLVTLRCLLLRHLGPINVYETGVSFILALTAADATFKTVGVYWSAIWGWIKKSNDLQVLRYNPRQR